MSLEDIEIKAPVDMAAEVFDGLFGEGQSQQPAPQAGLEPVVEHKQVGEAQPANTEQIDDVPNGAIRLDKMREQRDAERKRNAELEKRLAQMEGQISVLKPSNETEDAVDPTEYMSDTEKFLYEKNKQLEETLKKVTGVVDGIQTEGTRSRLQAQEDQFFENNPELKEGRQQFIDDMLGYLENKPAIKKMLKNGELTIQEIYGMHTAANPKSKKVAQVSSPAQVFSAHSNSMPANRAPDAEYIQARKKATQILHNPDSTNKKEAVEFLQKGIVQDIISLL